MDTNAEKDLLKVADLIGDAVTVVYNLTHGGSIFSAWVLTNDFSALTALPKGELLAAFKAMDDSGRLAMEAQLKSKIKIPDAAIQAKIDAAQNILEDCVELVYKAASVFNDGKAIVLEVENLIKK